MTAGIYIMVKFVTLFLDLILIAMLVRAVLSWFFMGDGESPIGRFLYAVTEPFVVPVRLLCARFGWFQGLPMDMSFFLTTVILGFINLLITGLYPV